MMHLFWVSYTWQSEVDPHDPAEQNVAAWVDSYMHGGSKLCFT